MYELTEEELPRFGPALTYWCANNCFPINGGHHGNIWGVSQLVYSDAELAIEEEAMYLQENKTRAEWQEQRAALVFSADLIDASEQMLYYVADAKNAYRPTAYYSYTTMATNEKADIIATYETDLTTYLIEMTTNITVGTDSVDSVDEKVPHALDDLGLREYYNVMQTRVNRYLEAIGRDAAPLMD